MYPYLALYSPEAIASTHPIGQAQGWYSTTSQVLQPMPSPIQILPRCVEPSLDTETGIESVHQRGNLQTVHSSHLDFTFNEFGLKDVLP